MIDPETSMPTLKRGHAGWFQLGTLGVACVISGEFAAWNWGLALGGWGGMLLATLATAVMYYALVFSIAELATIIPTSGAGYGFARSAFGPLAGFLTGIAVSMQYTFAVAVIAIFIGSYFSALTGISGWVVPTFCFAVACGLHCLGVGAAMRVMVALAAFAILGIVLFLALAAPYASWDKVLDISPAANRDFASRFVPFGWAGVWACLPFALAGFAGVESIPLASEEARDPIKDVPRGLVLALGTLFVTMLALLCLAPAVQGSRALASAGSPLVDALNSIHGEWSLRWATKLVNVAGLIGLGASFFSATFAYSRQIFALSRAGYLPRSLAATNRYHAPWLAITIPGVLAYVLSLTSAGDQLYVLVMLVSLVAYMLIFAAHLRLRRTRRRLPRPYRTPGGVATAWIGLVLTSVTFIACFLASPIWSCAGVGLLIAMVLYFFLYARHRVISHAPEEEFAMAKAAEASLD